MGILSIDIDNISNEDELIDMRFKEVLKAQFHAKNLSEFLSYAYSLLVKRTTVERRLSERRLTERPLIRTVVTRESNIKYLFLNKYVI